MGEPAKVVIVGGGPVGMCAAAALARADVPVVLFEAAPEPQTDWRASTFHAATLELLEGLDLTEPMLAEGLQVSQYQFRDRVAGLVAEFDLSMLADETRYPFRLQLNQQRLVAMLYDRLRQHPAVALRFGHEVTCVRSTGDGAVVEYRSPEGGGELATPFVVGADGAASVVRGHLGVEFEGFTYPQRFQIVSTSADLRQVIPNLADVNYVADPVEWLFILRTMESWRIVWPTEDPSTDHDSLAEHLAQLGPYPGGYEILDQQVYNVHQRVASRFVEDRVALIGDAAHINSPVGGVGLNSGIHDAFDLVTRLVRTIRGGEPAEEQLAAFGAVRRHVAVEYVQADTERNTRRLQERDPEVRAAMLADMRELANDPDRARAWLRRVTLLESVRRFGIGCEPESAKEHQTVGATREAKDVG